jgi:hypothetical protein
VSLGALQDSIWLHIGTRPPEHAGQVAKEAGGVVIQGPGQTRHALAAQAAHPFILQHDGKPVRQEGLFGADHDWLLLQTKAAVVTSRVDYLPVVGDDDALGEAVQRCRAFVGLTRAEDASGPALAVIGVHNRWLKDKRARSSLRAALASIDAAVGLMIGGSSHDPLDHPHKVEGLLELIGGLESLVLLRTDHAAAGAYAFGAKGGSVGLGTGTRHFVAESEFAQKDLDDPTPRVLLDAFHAWWKGSKIGPMAGDPLFDCACRVCEGRGLARFQSEVLTPEADRHSAAVWSSLLAKLKALEPGQPRQQEWLKMCLAAYHNLDALEDRFGLPAPASKQLKAWLAVAGVPAV